MGGELEASAELHASGLGAGASFPRPGLNQLALELRKAPHDSEHKPPLWGCSVGPGVSQRAEARACLGDALKRARLASFDLCPESPALGAMTQWTNTELLGEGRSLAEFKGKIVVLDFWATWCGPCIQSIPKNNEIAKKYADDGVVLIGVCHKDGGEKMTETIRSKKIEYPCVLDAKGEANAAFKVDGYPDYVIIDREGRVRGADVQNGQVQNAIEYLLHQEKKQNEAKTQREQQTDEKSPG